MLDQGKEKCWCTVRTLATTSLISWGNSKLQTRDDLSVECHNLVYFLRPSCFILLEVNLPSDRSEPCHPGTFVHRLFESSNNF